MIAFARIDLPEPFGPIRAWIRPFSTTRSRPLRISFSSTRTCRSRISSSAICSFLKWGSGDAGDGPLAIVLLGELDQLGQGGPGERPCNPALDPGPEQLGRAGVVAVGLVRAEDLAFRIGLEALHRRDRALQRLHHLEHLDLARYAGEPVPAVGPAL